MGRNVGEISTPNDGLTFFPPKEVGLLVVVVAGSDADGVIHRSIASTRSLSALARALSEASIEMKVFVVSKSPNASSWAKTALGPFLVQGQDMALDGKSDTAGPLADIVQTTGLSHTLLIRDSTAISQFWIDSLVAEMRDQHIPGNFFPTFRIDYGESFEIVDYRTNAELVQLAGASPFTELLPPVGVVSSEVVVKKQSQKKYV